MKSTICLITLCGALLASTAAAQPVAIQGTIVGIEGSRIGIRDASGRIFQAEVGPSWLGPDNKVHKAEKPPTISITGTEDPKNLRVGQGLQFTATLAGRRTLVGEVSDATLIAITPEARLGILNADPIEEAAGEDGEKKKSSNLEKCLVAGAITKIKYGVITVAVGPTLKALPVRFAAGTNITVSSSDLSVARIGDTVKATGTVISLPVFAATELSIEHTPAIDERPARRIKPEDVGIKKGKPGEREDPFKLGGNEPAGAGKPKVKLELIKTN